MIKDTLEPVVRRVASLQALVLVAASLMGAGAASVIYLSRFALAAEFHDHVATEGKRMDAIESRSAVLEALEHNIETDLHWQRDQAAETARQVGARVVPLPEHLKE